MSYGDTSTYSYCETPAAVAYLHTIDAGQPYYPPGYTSAG